MEESFFILKEALYSIKEKVSIGWWSKVVWLNKNFKGCFCALMSCMREIIADPK